jgi:hypothetical protein
VPSLDLLSGRIGSTSTTSCAAGTRRSAAPALPRLRRASGRAVSRLDFSSVGRTGSRCAPGHSVSRLDYSSPDCTGSTAPMSCIRTGLRRLTSPQRAALALAVRLVTRSRDSTAMPLNLLVGRTGSRRAPGHYVSRLDYLTSGCAGSTAPMPCIWTRRLAAQQPNSGRVNNLLRRQKLSHLFK